jgi:phosphatidate cytidylyltransferase
MLGVDQSLGPAYPFLFVFSLLFGALAAHEAVQLFPRDRRPFPLFVLPSVLLVLAANWPAHLLSGVPFDAWHLVYAAFTVVALSAFLVEIAVYREPGHSIHRVATATWLATYLGILPSFLIQLRWLGPDPDRLGDWRPVAALALAIFVPKACDIGAYFSGRLLGRHHMTPLLSPKKTWEGLVGGLCFSILIAVLLNRALPVLAGGDLAAIGFGVTVGLAGAIGDLAESLIKRDSGHKDASHLVPGFGGVLDVVDAILFAAPVAYLWLRV